MLGLASLVSRVCSGSHRKSKLEGTSVHLHKKLVGGGPKENLTRSSHPSGHSLPTHNPLPTLPLSFDGSRVSPSSLLLQKPGDPQHFGNHSGTICDYRKICYGSQDRQKWGSHSSMPSSWAGLGVDIGQGRVLCAPKPESLILQVALALIPPNTCRPSQACGENIYGPDALAVP